MLTFVTGSMPFDCETRFVGATSAPLWPNKPLTWNDGRDYPLNRNSTPSWSNNIRQSATE
jgi:hypothetical protein